MVQFIQQYKKKKADIYELAFEYKRKNISEFSIDEKQEFVNELDSLHEQCVIQVKRSPKGIILLDNIERTIIILKHNVMNSELLYLNGDLSYYLKNNQQYIQDEIYIKNIIQVMQCDTSKHTLNELSYLMFNDEKAILQPNNASVNGKKILSNLKINIEHYIETIAPFYFPLNPSANKILIVENKETCFSLFRLLVNSDIGGIIYGQGNAVLKIFDFLGTYGLDNSYEYLYYGDIDKEGFHIVDSLIERYSDYNIKLSNDLYNHLIKYRSRDLIRSREIKTEFSCLSHLEYIVQEKILFIINNEKCIPQEAFNFTEMEKVLNELHHRLC